VRALALLLFVGFAGIASAQTQPAPQDLRERVRNCAAVQETAQRLACYDQLGTEVSNTTADNWSITIDRERAQTIQRESFGLNLPSLAQILPGLGATEHVDAVEVQVERIIGHADDTYTFVMTNGQRWSQTEPLRPTNVRVGDTVNIRHGAMTSYILTSPTRGGRPHRVRRDN
jgi:hypothetical protein